MNFTQKIQKVFNTDKLFGKIIFIFLVYLLFFVVWFNFLIPSIFGLELSFFDFFNFKELSPFYSVLMLFSVFYVFIDPVVLTDLLIYYLSIIPILGFFFVNKFIFRILKINSINIKILFYILSIIFILLINRLLFLVMLSSIQPNFF